MARWVRVGAIDFAAMTGPSPSQDNLPLGERLARRWLDDWRGAAALVALLALASSITSITNGFAYDDLPIVLENKRIHDWRQLWRLFGQAYWEVNYAQRDLYRPMVLVSFGLQWAIGGGDPWVFHLVGVTWYMAVSVVLLLLLRRLLPSRAALVGGALWAVHPVHVEAVGNVVGQAEVMAAGFVVAALALYLAQRQEGGVTRRGVAGVVTCYVLGLLSKENAIVLPALLLVGEGVLRRGGTQLPTEDRSRRWVLARAVLLATIAFLVVRWVILGAVTGIPHIGFMGLSTSQRVWAASALWPEILRLLLWPARLYADYSQQQVTIYSTPNLVHLISLGILGAWGFGLWRAWRARHEAVMLGLAAFPITFGLVSNLLFPTGVLIAERTLFLPSVSVALLGGAAFAALFRPRGAPRLGWTLALILVAAGAVRSAARQSAWADSLTVFAHMIADAPTNARGHVVIGQLYMSLGEMGRAEPHLVRAYALQPAYGLVYASYLQKTRRCDQALPVAVAVLGRFSRLEEGHVTRIVCLLELRRFSEARRQALDCLTRGFTPPTFALLREVADSLSAASDSVDQRNRWVRAGRSFDRTGASVVINVSGLPRLGMAIIYGGRRETRPELRK